MNPRGRLFATCLLQQWHYFGSNGRLGDIAVQKKGVETIVDRQAIDRRIAFLLLEAAVESPVYDQAVRMTMRVVSNWVACGKDVSSSELKKRARHMSRSAYELRTRLNDHKLFARQTINEHPDELKQIWIWMVGCRGQLSGDDVLARFRRWPVIIITRDENRNLPKLVEPEKRYKGLELLAQVDGQWIPYTLSPSEI